MPRIPIRMPQLGESIAEATVVSIGVKAGEDVEPDQEIIDVETNKAGMGVTTPCGGKIVEITARPETSYAVGAVLGYLDATEEEAARAGLSSQPAPEVHASETPEALEATDDTNTDTSDAPDPDKAEEPQDRPHFAVEEASDFSGENGDADNPSVRPTVGGLPVPANVTGAAYLSPRMRARMQELGLNASDLSGVAGSGAGGRVTVVDFERFIESLEQQKTSGASPMRIAVADSLRRSWTRPLATVGIHIILDRVLVHRKSCKPKPGLALYCIRALALALAENTAVAGRLVGDRIVHPKAIDIGFAVEVTDGVLVPVLHEADGTKLADMVAEYQELVKQARARKLPPPAHGRSGIATVTNFGTFGITWATPIPLPEQSLVLGVGAGRKKPIWSDEVNQFVPATECELTLSFDHRVLDGGAAGRLLNRVAELLQTPEEL